MLILPILEGILAVKYVGYVLILGFTFSLLFGLLGGKK